MRYDPDLAAVSLHAYRELLKRQTLLPSRRLLLDDIDARFTRIQEQGVTSVAQLQKALQSSAKIEAFSKQSGVSAQYLAVLKRESGTLKPKAVPLKNFPDTDKAEIEALLKQGVTTSKAYFESRKDGGKLYALCDLSRINGVGPSAAAMFYEAGYRSSADVAAADAGEMLSRITAVNEGGRYYAGKLGEKDMRFCIDSADILLRFSE